MYISFNLVVCGKTCTNITNERMQQIKDSDNTFTMMASTAFDRILQEIQTSNLNFQLQVSPFSAQISLKKSLVKDRNGSCRLPPSESSFTRSESELSILQREKMQVQNDLKVLQTKYERVVSDCEDAFNRIKFLEGFQYNHFKIERDQKIKDEETCEHGASETAAALKTENESLKIKIEDQNQEIINLQNSLKVKIKVSEKLNKELSENKIKAEKEKAAIIKTYKAEVKSWRKDLGDVTRQKVKLEKKLEMNLEKKTGRVKLKTPAVSAPQPSLLRSTFPLPSTSCRICRGGNSGPFSTDSDPSLIPSLVSHWTPHVTTSYQRPANIPSMIAHCTLHVFFL